MNKAALSGISAAAARAQIVEVLADGLRANVKAHRKIIDGDPANLLGDLQNGGVASGDHGVPEAERRLLKRN
jgi:hypothetical protein